MEATARELHIKTRAQIFLVTINTIEGEPVETFANELFAKWKIGRRRYWWIDAVRQTQLRRQH